MRPVTLRPAIAVLLLVVVTTSCTGSEEDRADRVLLVGDSLMNQTAQPLKAMVPPSTDVRNESVVGSGLLSPWLFDWASHLPRVLDNYDPDVVIFLFTGNYALDTDERYTTDDGQRIENRRSEAFARAWQREAEELTRAAAETAEVIWVLPPPMRAGPDQAVVDRLRAGYQEVVEAVPGTVAIDANDVLANRNGRFQLRTQGQGAPERLRARDGVHLAPVGARRLAVWIEEAIDEQL
jgi:hypothetical protein